MSRATTASLSIALQAIPPHVLVLTCRLVVALQAIPLTCQYRYVWIKHGPAWKAVLSEAVVAGGEALG